MKKSKVFIFILVFLLLLGSFSSCQKGSSPSKSTLDQEEFHPPVAKTVIVYKDKDDLFSDRLDLKGQDLAGTPILINKYPFDQEGPAFEITQEIEGSLLDRFKLFADWFGLEGDLPEYKNEYGYLLQATIKDEKGEDVHVLSAVSNLSLSFANFGLDSKTDYGQIKEILTQNKYISTLLDLALIENPYIEREISYNNEGNISGVDFFVYEEDSDSLNLSVNKALNQLKISITEEGENLSVGHYFNEKDELEKSLPTISYKNAVKKLLADNKDFSEKDILACCLDYNSFVAPGYFVPCYMFYLDGGDYLADEGLKKANIYYVSAYDLAGLE